MMAFLCYAQKRIEKCLKHGNYISHKKNYNTFAPYVASASQQLGFTAGNFMHIFV